jgi:hypothetical protein
MHPHRPQHTFVTTMLDAGGDLRHVQVAARQFDGSVADLPKPPQGAGDDAEIVLYGDRCPAAAS